jgi:DNA repair protein RecO (recombination protein O)
MEWQDEAIVLSVRPYGETSAIVDALTHLHGRHAGLVHGGASRKIRAILQPGNSLYLTWRARLNEQLGTFHVEPLRARAGAVLERRDALIALNAFAAIASAVLPEREPHVGV